MADENENKRPIFIKTSITSEIYHGNSLKSRFEMNQCKIIPSTLEICNPPSKPLGKITSDNNLKKKQKKRFFKKLEVKERNIGNKHLEVNRNYFQLIINICSILFISVLLGKLIFPYIHLHGERSLLIDTVQKELYARLLNQNSSIETIIHNLEELPKLPHKKMITCLMGPTGVGKTYLINILSEQIESEFIRIYHSSELPDLIYKKGYAENFLSQKLYSEFLIIVVDDLKPGDLNRLKRLIEITFLIEDKNILILTVFNVETEGCSANLSDNNNPNYIRENLELLNEHVHFTHFQFLNESVVRLWLKRELTIQNIPFEFHDETISTLLKGQDIKCHGLKGLKSKLLLELSKYDEEN